MNERIKSLLEIGYPIKAATRILDVEAKRFENIVYRNKALCGDGSGHGRKRYFSFDNLIDIQAVLTLVDEIGLSAPNAAGAIEGYQISRWLYSDDPFTISRTPAGRWIASANPNSGISINIWVLPLYRKMRPRFLELFPAETEEFERRLVTDRERDRRRREGGNG